MTDYDALLTSQGIAHTTAPSQYEVHGWDTGWMTEALGTLYQDSLNLPVNPLKTSTGLTSSAHQSTFGQTVTLTATVSPSFSDRPTGTMTFTDGSRTLCNAVPVHGQANCAVSTLEPGAHSIVATYSGDDHYLPAPRNAGLNDGVWSSRRATPTHSPPRPRRSERSPAPWRGGQSRDQPADDRRCQTQPPQTCPHR